MEQRSTQQEAIYNRSDDHTLQCVVNGSCFSHAVMGFNGKKKKKKNTGGEIWDLNYYPI